MSYVLHYAPDNASLIVRLALEEIGAPYACRLVDRRAAAQRSPAYRALNPHGLIPVLETGDGPIFETAAILLWLAERHGALAPPPGAPGRGAQLKWLFHLSNGLHAHLRMLFYPAQYVGADAAAQAALSAQITARLREMLDRLEAEAARAEVLGGAEPTLCDLYLAVCLRWCALYPRGGTEWFSLDATPRLADLARRIEVRPAARAAARAEGLGDQPFSAPQLAKPPEGSAT